MTLGHISPLLDILISSHHGNHGDTWVAVVGMIAIKILLLPWQPYRYFGCHGNQQRNHGDTFVARKTIEIPSYHW